ncbi:hypothetical protein KC338_g99 [Hortaea werneckii]|nr:hypothetical protein KC338_g99 [Hortaea werneckii]
MGVAGTSQATLWDRSCKLPDRFRRRKQRSYARSASALPKDSDAGRVATEGFDMLVYPVECRDLLIVTTTTSPLATNDPPSNVGSLPVPPIGRPNVEEETRELYVNASGSGAYRMPSKRKLNLSLKPVKNCSPELMVVRQVVELSAYVRLLSGALCVQRTGKRSKSIAIALRRVPELLS